MQTSVTATATATASMVGSWSMSTSATATAVATPGSLLNVVDLEGEIEVYMDFSAALQLQIPVYEPPFPVTKVRRVSPVFDITPP